MITLPTLTPSLDRRFRGFFPIVIDVETGGFNPETDALLEIAAVFLDMDEQGNLFPHTTIQKNIIPFDGANIEESSLEFTGIDPFDPDRESISEHDALLELFSEIRAAKNDNACKRAILVGHNAQFDLSFINAATKRNRIKRNPLHSFSCFDTVTLAALALGETVLANACEVADINFNQKYAHNAAYDAEKTAELFCGIMNHWNKFTRLKTF